jgi:acyl transferase domain-containing protein
MHCSLPSSHLEITAFLASLSKVLSIFETGLIPPNANLINPNPAIEWDAYRLRVPTEATPLPKRNGRAIVAMTSSGIGGANGSLVIESPPERTGRCSDVEFWTSNASNRPHLFLCGGLSPRTASVIAQGLQLQREEGGMEEEALTFTYGRRARSMPWINYAVAPSNETAHFSEAVLVPKTRGPLVFVFSGQGPQHHASSSSSPLRWR